MEQVNKLKKKLKAFFEERMFEFINNSKKKKKNEIFSKSLESKKINIMIPS